MDETLRIAIERRMQSGEPFTFGDLWMPLALGDSERPEYRIADRLIQRYRKNGWAKIIGHKGRALLWQCDPASIGAEYRVPAP